MMRNDRRRRALQTLGRGAATALGVWIALSTPAAAQTTMLSGGLPLEAARIPDPTAPRGAWVRDSQPVPPCLIPPRIDGTLDDACWRTALHIRGFYRANSTLAVQEQTEAWICATKTHLYVAFHCLDAHPNLIRAGETQRNGNVFNDDNVVVHLDSQNQLRGGSDFAVTPRGTQWQSIEGGTTDNIRWAGDWVAAARQGADGWTAEFAIPFALMRYPRNAHAFGILLTRRMARESSDTTWPYLPDGATQNRSNYYGEISGLAPVYLPPRPVFLPYTLGTAGAGTSARTGLDIKYPLTTTITGLATLFPDFATIEQDVTNVNFSYTEKYVNDHRPFFSEGGAFMPGSDLFYSPRITSVDEGLKVVGKQNQTTVGMLATNAGSGDRQRAFVVSGQEDVGIYNNVSAALVGENAAGQPSSQAAKIEGDFGWRAGRDAYNGGAVLLPTWAGGQYEGSKKFVFLNQRNRPGQLAPYADYTDISPSFVNPLGYNPEVGLRGWSFNLDQHNNFDTGTIESYDVGLNGSSYNHYSGKLFHNDVNPYAGMGFKSGIGFGVSEDVGAREQFHDRVFHYNLYWGGKTQYQHGGFNQDIGRQDGQSYEFLGFSQQFLLRRSLNAQISLNRSKLGNVVSNQDIVTASWLLTTDQVVSARVVKQDSDINAFVSFGSHSRAGRDIFMILGDPNKSRTLGKLTLKVVQAY